MCHPLMKEMTVPQAPVEHQKRLLTVQDLDTAIAQAKHRVDTLPQKAQAAELDALMADLTAKRIEAETAVTDLQREVTKAEDDVQSVRTRAERDTGRLMGGGMTPKELEALQAELAVLAKRQAALEEIELDAMQRLEDAQNAADSVVAHIAQVQVDVDAVSAQLREAFDAAAVELDGLAKQRAEAVAGLDEGLVDLYEKLRAQNGGVGAAALVAGKCQGCNIGLNPVDLAAIAARAADDIVRCEECGRILVRVK